MPLDLETWLSLETMQANIRLTDGPADLSEWLALAPNDDPNLKQLMHVLASKATTRSPGDFVGELHRLCHFAVFGPARVVS